MTKAEAIQILTVMRDTARNSVSTDSSNANALDMAIKAIYTLTAISSICDTAEMIIEEQYGVVIVEGYADVFDLIKKKVRLWGMTIDEAIEHAEEVMVENLEKTKGRNASDPIALNFFKCAEEHRQLADWLKELKAVREAWTQLTETILELRDNGGTGTQKEIATFLVNYIGILEQGIMAEKERKE